MARKNDLRNQRAGTVINTTSARQEKGLSAAVVNVQRRLEEKFPNSKFEHRKQILLSEIVSDLQDAFPEVDFHFYHPTSGMKPDGGILYMLSNEGDKSLRR